MMELHSGYEMKIIFSSLCFPFEFWTTISISFINETYGSLKHSLCKIQKPVVVTLYCS